MSDFLLYYQAILACLELILYHLVYLLLQKIGLFLVKCWIFFEGSAECFLGNLEVIFDNNEGVLEYILEYFHLLFYRQKLLFGVCVGCTSRCDLLFEIRLSFEWLTMRFLMGS